MKIREAVHLHLDELLDEIDVCYEEASRLTDRNIALVREAEEVDQILGKALGYPEGFPEVNSVDDSWVNTGPNTIASLAEEVAEKIELLEEQNELLADLIKKTEDRCSRLAVAGLCALYGGIAYGLFWGWILF
jgi:hypothetical protein